MSGARARAFFAALVLAAFWIGFWVLAAFWINFWLLAGFWIGFWVGWLVRS